MVFTPFFYSNMAKKSSWDASFDGELLKSFLFRIFLWLKKLLQISVFEVHQITPTITTRLFAVTVNEEERVGEHEINEYEMLSRTS